MNGVSSFKTMLDEDSNNNNEDAASFAAIDLRRVTSSENNALILLKINDSFRDGLAANKSIKELHIQGDLREEGVQGLAPLFRNTNTLTELLFNAHFISTESLKSFALLLSQCQIKSLKRISFEEFELNDSEYTEIARALSMQPQLEVLDLSDLYGDGEYNDSFLGHITLGDAMKHWKSPCLKKLEMDWCLIDDDGMVALVEGMANYTNLERLNLAGNDTITEIGLRALSSLFQSKKFLRSIDFSCMDISDDGMTALAPGLASLESLRMLDLSSNIIGDEEGLEALATAQPHFRHLKDLQLSDNAGFTVAGMMSLSSLLQKASSLMFLFLSNNSIDDEGLQVFITGMRGRCTIGSLDLSSNDIRSGVRSFAAVKMNSLGRLDLDGNNVGNNDEAMEALVEAVESLRNLDYLKLSRVSPSGLTILATIFRSESCSLQELNLSGTRMEDRGAIALANGLKGNQTLRSVTFDHRSLTYVGWSAFEWLLCDSFSVNNTYCSNHTLLCIEKYVHDVEEDIPFPIEALLDLNKLKGQGVNVPICKILTCHSDLDMSLLLRWKLKLLPFIVTWLERARSSGLSLPRAAFECRKLSAIYQFIGGLSHLVVEGYAHCEKRTIVESSLRKRKSTHH